MYTFFFRNCHWLVDHHFVYPWCVLCAYQISSETDSNFAGRGFLVAAAAAAWFIALCVHIDFMCCWATAACCCIYPRRAFRRPRWRPHLFFAPHTLQLFLLPVEEEKRLKEAVLLLLLLLLLAGPCFPVLTLSTRHSFPAAYLSTPAAATTATTSIKYKK